MLQTRVISYPDLTLNIAASQIWHQNWIFLGLVSTSSFFFVSNSWKPTRSLNIQQAKIACKVQRKGGEEAAPLALAVVMIAPWACQSIGGLNGRSTVAGAPPCKDDHFSQMKCLFCTAADKRPSVKFLSEAHSLFLLYLLDFDCSLCFPFVRSGAESGGRKIQICTGRAGAWKAGTWTLSLLLSAVWLDSFMYIIDILISRFTIETEKVSGSGTTNH